jgi:hypothetical protein
MTLLSSWLLFGVIFTALLYVLAERLFRFPACKLHHVIAAVRLTHEEEFSDLMDAMKEANLRTALSRKQFRQEQGVRIRLAFEYLRRMSFNSLIILSWAYAEQASFLNAGSTEDQERAYIIEEIIQAGIEFRIYSIFGLLKLILWIAFRMYQWPLLPVPSIADMREMANVDGVYAYSRVITAAGYLAHLCYGNRAYKDLMGALRGMVPAS